MVAYLKAKFAILELFFEESLEPIPLDVHEKVWVIKGSTVTPGRRLCIFFAHLELFPYKERGVETPFPYKEIIQGARKICSVSCQPGVCTPIPFYLYWFIE